MQRGGGFPYWGNDEASESSNVSLFGDLARQLVVVPGSGGSPLGTPRDEVQNLRPAVMIPLEADHGRVGPTSVRDLFVIPQSVIYGPQPAGVMAIEDAPRLPTIDIPGLNWGNNVGDVEMGEENPKEKPLIRNRSPDGSQSSEPPRKAPAEGTQKWGGWFKRGPHKTQ